MYGLISKESLDTYSIYGVVVCHICGRPECVWVPVGTSGVIFGSSGVVMLSPGAWTDYGGR